MNDTSVLVFVVYVFPEKYASSSRCMICLVACMIMFSSYMDKQLLYSIVSDDAAVMEEEDNVGKDAGPVADDAPDEEKKNAGSNFKCPL